MDLNTAEQMAKHPVVGTLAQHIAPFIPPGPDAHFRALELADQIKDGFSTDSPAPGQFTLVSKNGRPVKDEMADRLGHAGKVDAEGRPVSNLGTALLRLQGKAAALQTHGKPGGLHGGLPGPGSFKPLEPKPPFGRR